MPAELQPWPLTAAFHCADKKRRHGAATNNAVRKRTERNCCVLWAIKILFIPPLKQVLARGRHALNKLESLQHFTPNLAFWLNGLFISVCYRESITITLSHILMDLNEPLTLRNILVQHHLCFWHKWYLMWLRCY